MRICFAEPPHCPVDQGERPNPDGEQQRPVGSQPSQNEPHDSHDLITEDVEGDTDSNKRADPSNDRHGVERQV